MDIAQTGEEATEGLSEAELRRAEDACRVCPACDVGMAAGCSCDPEPRAVVAYLLTEVERLTAEAALSASTTTTEDD